jgi:hypothetical protein
MGEQVRGYLVVKVLEAAGHNGEDRKVWDDTLKEAFVKSKFVLINTSVLMILIGGPLAILGRGQ